MVIHGKGGVTPTEPDPSITIHQDNVTQLAGTLSVLLVTSSVTEPCPEGGTGAGGQPSVGVVDEPVEVLQRRWKMELWQRGRIDWI